MDGFMVRGMVCLMVCPTQAPQDPNFLSKDELFELYINAKRIYREAKVEIILHPIRVDESFGVKESEATLSLDPCEHGTAIGFSNCSYLVKVTGIDVGAPMIHDAIVAGLAARNRIESESLWVVDCRPDQHKVQGNRSPASALMRNGQLPGIHGLREVKSSISYLDDEWVWASLPIFLADKSLSYAAHFLNQSFKSCFSFAHEDDFINNPDDSPLLISESVELENALHNAFKVFEAIYGGRLRTKKTSNHQRICDRFAVQGVRVDASYGYPSVAGNEQSFLEKLNKLESARDEKSAHGRVAGDAENRKISYLEVMDYQRFAGEILRSVLLNRYPRFRERMRGVKRD